MDERERDFHDKRRRDAWGEHSPDMALFGLGVQMQRFQSGARDRGQSFPMSDAEDLGRGARFIPGEVTLARRRGERVEFMDRCTRCCWYWLFEDGSRVYHWEEWVYSQIGRHNGREFEVPEHGGSPRPVGGAGPCPDCRNPFTNGGHVPHRVHAATALWQVTLRYPEAGDPSKSYDRAVPVWAASEAEARGVLAIEQRRRKETGYPAPTEVVSASEAVPAEQADAYMQAARPRSKA
jgi:hypothetical protein